MPDGFELHGDRLESYNLKEEVVAVPDTVRIIGAGAFKGCASIKEIILPESLAKIENAAFKGCRNLTKIDFPKSLVEIGDYAFHRCHSLKQVLLPIATRSVGPCAFLFCDNLELASMPGAFRLGKQVFINNTNLEEVVLSSDLDPSCICDVFTGCIHLSRVGLSNGEVFEIDNLIDFLTAKPAAHPVVKAVVGDILRMVEVDDAVLKKFRIDVRELEIPNGIKAVAKNCFADKKGIRSLKLPRSLIRIGQQAFRNCTGLEEIEFLNDDVEIDADAFTNCTTLKQIRMPNSTTYKINAVINVPDAAAPALVKAIHKQVLSNFFVSGKTLVRYRGKEARVIVPDGIASIGERAFEGNEAVVEVLLPKSVEQIDTEAFLDCVMLQRIDMPDGLRRIGEAAFENCLKLLRVRLPDSITVIEKSTFNRCKSLTHVQWGDDVGSIGDLAFYGCKSLRNIEFPAQMTHIGSLAFYKCSSLTSLSLPSSIVEIGGNAFTKSGVNAVVFGCDLKAFGGDIFSQCERLKEIDIGEGVRHIGDKFAYECKSLVSVSFPDTIETIGRGAFEGSPFLETSKGTLIQDRVFLDGRGLVGEVVLPEGITAVAGGAFYGNTEVTAVSLPDSLQSIGARCFSGCTGLTAVRVPMRVSVIEEGCFAYCTSLQRVDFDGPVTEIRDRAFYRCAALSRIALPKIESVGEDAFAHCTALEETAMGNRDVHILGGALSHTKLLNGMREHSPLVIGSNTVVDGGTCAGAVSVPEGVRNISPYAFAGNKNILHLSLPSTLADIGDFAFSGCANLEAVTFSGTVNRIGKRAFEKCVSLKEIDMAAAILCEGAFSFCIKLEKAVWRGTHTFGRDAFSGCLRLAVLSADAVQTVGEGSFEGCISLARFDMQNVKFFGRRAFSGCTGLTRVAFGAEARIEARAFEDCAGIKEICFSDEEVRFDCYAFLGCTGIDLVTVSGRSYRIPDYTFLFDTQSAPQAERVYQSAMSCFEIDENLAVCKFRSKGRAVRIPSGIRSIESEVFKDALNLEEIEIPKSVRYIGGRAFRGTKWLEKRRAEADMVIVNDVLIDGASCERAVVIPEHVHTVSGWAFADNDAIVEILFTPTKTRLEPHAFRNCINLKSVVTTDGHTYRLNRLSDPAVDGYPEYIRRIFADCFNCFKTDERGNLVECTGNIRNLVMPDGIVSIGESVFKESNLLRHITLSKDVAHIGAGAFEKSKWLASVENGVNVRRIEKGAFSGCLHLETVCLFEKLEFLGERSFENCTSLKTIALAEGITEIPDKAFYRCASLGTVKLPSSLKRIGKEAFAFCYNLEKIDLPSGLETIDSRAFAWCESLRPQPFAPHASVKSDAFAFAGR